MENRTRRKITPLNAMLTTNPTNPIKRRRTIAKTKEPTTFPFVWLYGRVEELSGKEKEKFGVLLHSNKGRRKHARHCSLCGLPKPIEYRKTSDGNSSVICRDCAVQYCKSVLDLQQSGKLDISEEKK